MKNDVLVVLFTMAVASALHTYGQKRPELAPAPPMGWNSWNWFGKQEINEKIVYEVIDAMVDNGLRDAGYEYVVIDGGWRDTILSPEGNEASIDLTDIGRHKNVVIKDIIHNDVVVTTGNKITRVLKPHECAFLVISEK